jgi:adenylate cyclase
MQLSKVQMTLVIPLKFERFTLDLDRLCLLGPSGHIDLRPKSFDVLRYLVEHAGRVVTKDEVIASVWPHATVTDESLTVCISEVRRALGDADQRILRTVPRRGYLFDVAVSIDDEPSSQAIAAGRNDQPVVAVLPFENMSGDPRQDHLADAMTEEIITALSRFSDLFVIARKSSFAYKGAISTRSKSGTSLGLVIWSKAA